MARIVIFDHQISISPECCINLSAPFKSALEHSCWGLDDMLVYPVVSKPWLNRCEVAVDYSFTARPQAPVLKLRCSRLREVNGLERQGDIITRCVSEGSTEKLVKREIAIPR
jgi:hypothetical protein